MASTPTLDPVELKKRAVENGQKLWNDLLEDTKTRLNKAAERGEVAAQVVVPSKALAAQLTLELTGRGFSVVCEGRCLHVSFEDIPFCPEPHYGT